MQYVYVNLKIKVFMYLIVHIAFIKIALIHLKDLILIILKDVLFVELVILKKKLNWKMMEISKIVKMEKMISIKIKIEKVNLL